MKRLIILFAVAALLLSCQQNAQSDGATVDICFDGATATCSVKSSKDLKISIVGANVEVSSVLKDVEYRISGTTPDGQLKIYSTHKFVLALNDASITNKRGSAINIQTGKKATVTLTGNSRLEDAAIYTDTVAGEDEKACLFSEGQLVFNGQGALTVIGNRKHAICSDDYIRVESGTLTAEAAVSDALHAKDYFRCDGGTLCLTANGDGGDGIDVSKGYIAIAGGKITVAAKDEGITASMQPLATDTIVPDITVTGGDITIVTDGERAHGFKTATSFVMSGGSVAITTQGPKSDGINVDGNIVLNGGTLRITATDDCTNKTPTGSAVGNLTCL